MSIINLTIENKNDFYEKYNNKQISTQLLNYIIGSAMAIQASSYKIIIDSNLNEDFETIIKEGLKKELEINLNNKILTNIKQIYLIFIGAIFIGLSIYLKNYEMWHELILILGWVPIWETINIEMFNDSKARRKRKIIEQLLKSKIEIKKETK